MNNKVVRFSFAVIVLMLASCSPVSQALVTPVNPDLAPASIPTFTPPPASTPTFTPPQADTPTAKPLPTDTLTPTPSLPVFDLAALGDNRVLASFILTFKFKYTGGGTVTEYQNTIKYIKEPFGASQLKVNNGYQSISYWIGDWMYTNSEQAHQGHWTIGLASDPHTSALLQVDADMRQNAGIRDLKSARFVGQEDFQGIPANHFAFDQTDFTAYGITGDRGYKIDKAQGDFYLAQDSNAVLYFHSKVTGNVYVNPKDLGYIPGVEEITKELSSINQLKEITLPADYLALKLEPELGLPLPADTKVVSLDHYLPHEGGDIYSFKTSVSNAEFLQFYKDLAPTNGWTVSQVGPIPEPSYCSQGCATLKKGHAVMVLHMDDSGISPWGITIIGYYSK